MNSEADRRGLALNGAGILITRPIEQCEGIAALVNAHGGTPYVVPCLEITLSPVTELRASLSRIQSGDVLIFVSANAVRGVFQNVSDALRYHLASAQIAAVGERTQAALAAENLFVAISPDSKHQNSEGLLQHPLLQDLTGRHVFIVRGQCGRETLRETLVERGAKLEYIQAYTRAIPLNYDRISLVKKFRAEQIHYVMLTSFAAFENLVQMLGPGADSMLKRVQLVVPGTRVAQKIRERYSFPLREARNASDKEMLTATKPL
ncbi:MAG: uroporphyrinogen-III synthase [Proteobacteria bacterium]|nr:uroporphyrinogen-III synthase [Pseudomonadota bacterium]